MRYTQYDRDLGRWVVPCFYKVDGEKITFFVKYEPGETVKNNKANLLLTPGYELVFGEVIDRLAELENNSERMTELLLKREDMMSKLAKEKQEYFDLINRQKAEIEKVKPIYNSFEAELECAKSKAIKEFAERVDVLLKRYAHLHKYADAARQSTEDYVDGTPMEMVSVWEVLSLKKWEMVEYETMNELQDNIEVIAKERLLSEIEKDFRLLVKEMTEEATK